MSVDDLDRDPDPIPELPSLKELLDKMLIIDRVMTEKRTGDDRVRRTLTRIYLIDKPALDNR